MYVESFFPLWDKMMSGGKKFGEQDLFDPLEMEAWRELTPQLVVFYRTMNKAMGMDLEERRKRQRSAVNLSASLAIVQELFLHPS